MIKKTLQPTNDLFIQFSDEEVRELGLEQGQKFSVTPHDDGSFELRPYVKLELDMEEWPREILEMIIKKSVDEDISANDVINNLIKESLNDLEQVYDEDHFSDVTKSSCEDLTNICGCSSYDIPLPTASNLPNSNLAGNSNCYYF